MVINQTYLKSTAKSITVEVAGGIKSLSVRVQEREVDTKATVNAFIPNLIHSQDAAVTHHLCGLPRFSKDASQIAAIHDS